MPKRRVRVAKRPLRAPRAPGHPGALALRLPVLRPCSVTLKRKGALGTAMLTLLEENLVASTGALEFSGCPGALGALRGL